MSSSSPLRSLRRSFLPKIASESVALGFVLFIIPAIYIFEMSVVLPAVFGERYLWQYFHSVCGTFVMFNLVGNLVAVVLVDTSSRRTIVDTSQADPAIGWHLCSTCETLSPPRTWHCETCKTCILKRDHHCAFTGCCVGYYNFRFFYLFLMHLFVATVYASYYNNYFVWSLLEEVHWTHIVRMVVPVSILLFGFDTSTTQLYIFYYSVTIIGCLFTGVLLYQQTHLVLRNQTSYERGKRTLNYNLGPLDSVRDSLGLRWYLTWLSPFVDSPLPHNGTRWASASKICEDKQK